MSPGGPEQPRASRTRRRLWIGLGADEARPLSLVMGLGVELVGLAGGGTALGAWLDGKYLTGPWLMLAGAVLGVALGFYEMIKIALAARDEGPKRQ